MNDSPDHCLRPTLSSGAGASGGQGQEEECVVEEGEDKEIDEDSVEVPGVPEAIEEARAPRIARRPNTPTKAEVEEHMPLHIHYRSWCPHCVAGKGIPHQHRTGRETDEEQIGVTIRLDYCFFSLEDEEEDKDLKPILVVYDHSKRAIWAMAVEEKGPDRAAVEWIVEK